MGDYNLFIKIDGVDLTLLDISYSEVMIHIDNILDSSSEDISFIVLENLIFTF